MEKLITRTIKSYQFDAAIIKMDDPFAAPEKRTYVVPMDDAKKACAYINANLVKPFEKCAAVVNRTEVCKKFAISLSDFVKYAHEITPEEEAQAEEDETA